MSQQKAQPRPTSPSSGRARTSEVRVEDHLPLAWSVILRGPYKRLAHNAGISVDDLVQEAALGMIRAKQTWDPSIAGWSTYATYWIRHHVGRYLQDHGAAVRVPVYLQERRRAAGEHPRASVSSLDRRVGDDTSEGAPTFLDYLCYPEPEHSREDLPDVTLEDLIASTPELREKEIHVLRGRAQGKLLDEIGAELDRSRERIRQLEVAAIRKIQVAQGIAVPETPDAEPSPYAPKVEVPKVEITDAVEREIIRLRGQGLGVRAVAKQVGVAHHAVSRIERALLARIAAALEPAA